MPFSLDPTFQTGSSVRSSQPDLNAILNPPTKLSLIKPMIFYLFLITFSYFSLICSITSIILVHLFNILHSNAFLEISTYTRHFFRMICFQIHYINEKSFLNQTTLLLRKEKWTFLNQEFTVKLDASYVLKFLFCAPNQGVPSPSISKFCDCFGTFQNLQQFGEKNFYNLVSFSGVIRICRHIKQVFHLPSLACFGG